MLSWQLSHILEFLLLIYKASIDSQNDPCLTMQRRSEWKAAGLELFGLFFLSLWTKVRQRRKSLGHLVPILI